MTIQFWSNELTILFNKEYLFELWPTTEMCYEQKLNAITRLVILITILGYILTMSLRILGVGIITLLIIYILKHIKRILYSHVCIGITMNIIIFSHILYNMLLN